MNGAAMKQTSNITPLPSIKRPNQEDYTPKTEIKLNIPTDDGLTHEEKSVAITRLSRNGKIPIIFQYF